MVEVDHVDLAISPARAWEIVRHANLARGRLTRALFKIRTLPDRIRGKIEELALRVDDLRSTPERPGFQILADEPREVVVGAIGKVWKPTIPFAHVAPDAYAAFAEPDFVKVAWAISVSPLGAEGSRVTIEVRVDATTDAAWRKFRRYFRVIGIGSHFIRRSLLAELAREHGRPAWRDDERPIAGDSLLPDARYATTHAITIAATPEAIWPWLVQLGCHRAGFYSYDVLDNGGERSAREVHPELQRLEVGQVLPATPKGTDGFEVLAIDPNRSLVLGGLYDLDTNQQRPFAAARPRHFWQTTWAFELEPLGPMMTRLRARGHAAFSDSARPHAAWMSRAHDVMQRAQLRNLARRVEGRVRRDDWHDVVEGAGGAAVMIGAMVTPFRRGSRTRWGLDEAAAERAYPGDDFVPEPRWMWTHAVEIDAPPDRVWPWIAQLGADRAGFYSYQFLENLAGCNVRNAETVHEEWVRSDGAPLSLHPKLPPFEVETRPNEWLLARLDIDETCASWLVYLEPLGPGRCRCISRYRCVTSSDLASRIRLGPALLEPISFAMDKRMLAGIKRRAERARAAAAAGA